MAERLCLVVCPLFEIEVRAALDRLGTINVVVNSFPKSCETLKVTPEAVSHLITQTSDDCTILVLICSYAMRKPKEAEPRTRQRVHILDQCFDLLIEPEQLAKLQDAGAHLFTPRMLASWPNTLAGWGFDQQTARAFFGESTTILIGIDTYGDARLSEDLASLSRYLDIPSEVVATNQKHFESCISALVTAYSH